MWFNRPTTDRNYSGEQKVGFESPAPFSKCIRAKIYCNMNVHFDPQGCQTLLLKESEPFLLSLGSWTMSLIFLDWKQVNNLLLDGGGRGRLTVLANFQCWGSY